MDLGEFDYIFCSSELDLAIEACRVSKDNSVLQIDISSQYGGVEHKNMGTKPFIVDNFPIVMFAKSTLVQSLL